MQKFIFKTTLAPVIDWFEDSLMVDVLPRLQKLNVAIREGIPLWQEMLNGLTEGHVTHFCYSSETGGRCCADADEACSLDVN